MISIIIATIAETNDQCILHLKTFNLIRHKPGIIITLFFEAMEAAGWRPKYGLEAGKMENASKLGYKSIIPTSLDITSISIGNNCSYNGNHGAILKKSAKWRLTLRPCIP